MAITFTHVALPIFEPEDQADDQDGTAVTAVEPLLFEQLAHEDRYRHLFGLPPREVETPPRTVYDLSSADTALMVGVIQHPDYTRRYGGDPSSDL